MRKLLIIAAVVVLPALALAENITISWDQNPPEEQVTEYAVFQDGVEVWAGPETSATLDVQPGAYTYTVRARNLWGESADSEPVSTPSPVSAPTAPRITITITIQ